MFFNENAEARIGLWWRLASWEYSKRMEGNSSDIVKNLIVISLEQALKIFP